MPPNDPASDRDRTIIEVVVGATIALAGGLVVWLAPGIMIIGVVPLVLGVLGVVHAIAVWIGAIGVPRGGSR